jgi:hypothetical protein
MPRDHVTPNLRRFALTVHVTCSQGWVGAAFAYLALGIAAVTSHDELIIRTSWLAMDLVGWYVIVPLAIASLLTGIVMSLGTRWGLLRHYWVLIALVLTILAAAVLLLHMPTVSGTAEVARRADDAGLHRLGGDVIHPGLGVLVLLTVTVLNMYKPRGVTPYGRRISTGNAPVRR